MAGLLDGLESLGLGKLEGLDVFAEEKKLKPGTEHQRLQRDLPRKNSFMRRNLTVPFATESLPQRL